MQYGSPFAVVRAWLDAANRQNAERLIELSDPDIEVVGPRGSGHGHQLLRDWLTRAGLTLETRRAFARGEAVVVAQRGVWRSVATGQLAGERDVASRFRVGGGRIVQFPGTTTWARREAGLDSSDEVLNAS